MHMWLALHAHRRVHPQQYTLIIRHAQEACRVLKGWIQGTSVESAKAKESPRQVRTARKEKGKTATVRAIAAATRKAKAPKTSKVVPITPKRPRSKYVTPSFPCHFQFIAATGSDPSREVESQPVLGVEKDVTLMRKASRRIVALMSMQTSLGLRSC
jgi:hypothetical protein